MAINAQPPLITSSYARIIARELHLQERDLPELLQGTATFAKGCWANCRPPRYP